MRLWPDDLEAARPEIASLAPRITEALFGDRRPPPGCVGDELVAFRRAELDRMASPLPGVDDVTVAGRACRVAHALGTPRAAVVNFHGGGMVTGSPVVADRAAVDLAERHGVTVVSVGYRLAPEHPWPAAHEDALAVAATVAADSERFGTDRIVLAGDSAGATLAAATAVGLRDRTDLLDRCLGLVLVHGLYDWGGTPSQTGVRPSEAPDTLDPETIAWFTELYLPGTTVDERRRPEVSPARADLRGLPPALVAVGTADHLVDDSLVLAGRWAAAGNDVDLVVIPDAPHGFPALPSPAADHLARRTSIFYERILAIDHE